MWPSACSAAARLAVIVDLPTPPLPEATQITFLTWARAPSGSLRPAELLLEPGLLAVGEDVEADVDGVHALELGDVLDDGLLEVVADRAAGGGQRDDDLDAAVVADLDRAHHPELDDRYAAARGR